YGNRQIGFHGARLDLVEQRVPQRLLMRCDGIGVFIFCGQMRKYLWAALLAQPLVVVNEVIAVEAAGGGQLRGTRRIGSQRFRSHTPIQSHSWPCKGQAMLSADRSAVSNE